MEPPVNPPTLLEMVKEAAWLTHAELGQVYMESHCRDTLVHYLQQAGLTTTCEETVVFKTSFGLQLAENGRLDIVVERQLGDVTEAMILELKVRTNPTRTTLLNAKAQTQRYINQFRRLGFVVPALLVWFTPGGQNKVGFLEFPAIRRNTIIPGHVV